jgi:hypothetical protein
MNDIIKQAKVRFNHNQNKQLLKEKYKSKMMFASNGGMWNAGPELLSILATFDTDTIVLVDLYSNPVQVNRLELITEVKQRWQEQMNAWLIEFQQSSRQR